MPGGSEGAADGKGKNEASGQKLNGYEFPRLTPTAAGDEGEQTTSKWLTYYHMLLLSL